MNPHEQRLLIICLNTCSIQRIAASQNPPGVREGTYLPSQQPTGNIYIAAKQAGQRSQNCSKVQRISYLPSSSCSCVHSSQLACCNLYISPVLQM